jgi:hypothetical protein
MSSSKKHRKKQLTPSSSSFNWSPSLAAQEDDSFVTESRSLVTEVLRDQLCRDIQEAGGIESVVLHRLFDSKPDVYGKKGSTTRKKIAKFAYNLKYQSPVKVLVQKETAVHTPPVLFLLDNMSDRFDRSLLERFVTPGFDLDNVGMFR